MITNINTGLCQHRLQTGEPPYYLNWQEDGENKGEFFQFLFRLEDVRRRLEAKEQEQNNLKVR